MELSFNCRDVRLAVLGERFCFEGMEYIVTKVTSNALGRFEVTANPLPFKEPKGKFMRFGFPPLLTNRTHITSRTIPNVPM